MSDKDQVTNASAIELEEAQLDAVAGGGALDALKAKLEATMSGKIPASVTKLEQKLEQKLGSKLPGGLPGIGGKLEPIISKLKP